MRTICRLFLGVTFGLLLLAAAGVVGVKAKGFPEDETTWRSGDAVLYSAGCHEAADMAASAEAYERGDTSLFMRLMRQGRCFVIADERRRPVQIGAELQERVSRTYCIPNGPCGSVWRIEDAAGDTEYMLLADDAGPHEKAVGA